MINKLDRIYEIQSNKGVITLLQEIGRHVLAHPDTKNWINLVGRELKEEQFSQGWKRRLWLYRQGFLTQSDILYDIDGTSQELYLSDYNRYVHTPKINGDFSESLNNKLFTYWLLNAFNNYLPELYGIVNDNRYYPVDTESPTHTQPYAGNADDIILEKVQTHGSIVLKGIKGGRGKRIHLCKLTKMGYEINGDLHTESEFRSRISNMRESIVTEYITQGSYAEKIYPKTMNTIRVLTMVDPETQDPFVAIAVQRFGSNQSGSVDSWSQGGLCAEVDLKTGTLSQGVQSPSGDQIKWHDTHPDTGSQIKGVGIPGWKSIKQSLLEIANHISYVNYAGWDLLVTDQGKFKIIEVNNHTDVDLLQVHRPLLADDRIRQFYRFHGVI